VPVSDGERLRLLAGLARELAGQGLNVGMSDAHPALTVRGGLAGRKMWIFVDPSGASFMWRRDDHDSHAVDDPAGAAKRVAGGLRECDPASGEGS
jgi:hypothetical protein